LPVPERHAKNDACVECHMPRTATADVSHTAVTDHRIVRRPGKVFVVPPDVAYELPIRSFHAGSKYGPSPEEHIRDLGIALAYLVRLNKARGVNNPNMLDLATDYLRRSTKRFPSDAIAWEALAVVLGADNQAAESLAAAEKSIAVGPAREPALHHAIMTALRLRDLDKARSYARKAVEINPGNPLSRMMLGLVLTEAHEWKEGAEVLRSALSDMPGHPDGRAALAVCLFHTGDRLGSQTEVDRLVAIAPEQANSWREWVRRRTAR
jgi:predicted Zn-dependent protease